MNTAIYSPSGSSAGIGFAIPVDTLKYEVNTLIRDGKVIRPAIGVSYLSSSQSQLLGINKGILILDINDNSNAKKSGLKGTVRRSNGDILLGDIIIAVDNDEVRNESDLFKAIEKHKVNDEVTITVLRNADLDQFGDFQGDEDVGGEEEDNGVTSSLFRKMEDDSGEETIVAARKESRRGTTTGQQEAKNQVLKFKIKLISVEPSLST